MIGWTANLFVLSEKEYIGLKTGASIVFGANGSRDAFVAAWGAVV